MKLHLLALPHTQTTDDFSTCAYTQKIVKFCRMMEGHHDVILYGPEVNTAPATEHVQLISEEERVGWFGERFDTVNGKLEWNESVEYWRKFNARATAAVMERVESPRDEILLLTTSVQSPVARALGGLEAGPRLITAEWAVGYEGVQLPFAAFESYAWMHHVHGILGHRQGRWYDAVIPNFFDPAEFPIAPPTGEIEGDYLLYVGRVIPLKGVVEANLIAKRVGLPLVVAGPGVIASGEGWLRTDTLNLEGDIRYVGEVGPSERNRLMRGARALLAPTLYIEPFGGVAVEAMMCGTPAITSDWGAFTETVPERFRFRTLQQGAECVGRAIEERSCSAEFREYAVGRYSLDAVRPRFDEWFEQLLGLWGEGWTA